jgi:hypothetical protein
MDFKYSIRSSFSCSVNRSLKILSSWLTTSGRVANRPSPNPLCHQPCFTNPVASVNSETDPFPILSLDGSFAISKFSAGNGVCLPAIRENRLTGSELMTPV